MLQVVDSQGGGWVDYMWPKPGESVSTQKSAYVVKVPMGDTWVMAGCGVYLSDAVKSTAHMRKVTADELIQLVRDAAVALEKRGEEAYMEFRKAGSKWLHDDTYIFVWSMDGTRTFHGADPSIEGQYVADLKDNLGRPFGKMFLETATAESGEGWVHYLYPEPGNIFPTWKSTFIKRVRLPSGMQYLVGCGIYNMDMNKAFVEDVVNRAAALVEAQGPSAFGILRDKKGPFYFLDTYVFVDDRSGVELVNPAYPSLEGKNLIAERDLKGKLVVRDYIAAVEKKGHAWVEYYWYRPGQNDQAVKHAYVREVTFGGERYIVGAGYFDPQ
jgi:signal transduction histidine kinase